MKKIIFMGTPEFGSNALKTLISQGFKPILVVCQPDRKFNRNKSIIFSPVKKLAIKENISIIQPEKINDSYEFFLKIKADLMITAAYGQFIPKKILELFPLGAWNIHGSLLPKLRGGAPIHWAIINNETETGISLMRMVPKMDSGNVIGIEKVKISKEETYKTLHEKMLIASRSLIKNYFRKIIDQNFYEILQNPKDVTFGYNITNEQSYIDWLKSDLEIDCFVRGLNDYPVSRSIYGNASIKIYECKLTNETSDNHPGFIIDIDKNGIQVVCGNKKIILLTKIQLPGKNVKFVHELINGKIIFEKNNFFQNKK